MAAVASAPVPIFASTLSSSNSALSKHTNESEGVKPRKRSLVEKLLETSTSSTECLAAEQSFTRNYERTFKGSTVSKKAIKEAYLTDKKNENTNVEEETTESLIVAHIQALVHHASTMVMFLNSPVSNLEKEFKQVNSTQRSKQNNNSEIMLLSSAFVAQLRSIIQNEVRYMLISLLAIMRITDANADEIVQQADALVKLTMRLTRTIDKSIPPDTSTIEEISPQGMRYLLSRCDAIVIVTQRLLKETKIAVSISMCERMMMVMTASVLMAEISRIRIFI